jgi:hypothetical protein
MAHVYMPHYKKVTVMLSWEHTDGSQTHTLEMCQEHGDSQKTLENAAQMVSCVLDWAIVSRVVPKSGGGQ